MCVWRGTQTTGGVPDWPCAPDILSPFPLPRRVQGVRLAAALLLEAADVLVPLLVAAARRLGHSLAFVLEHVLGRAVGKVWRGMQGAA